MIVIIAALTDSMVAQALPLLGHFGKNVEPVEEVKAPKAAGV